MKHVSTMSFTASIGLLAIFAVDFVDMIFISMLGHAELAAAIGYAGTLLFVSSSISIGMSIAAGVIVSRGIGNGHTEKAAQSASNVALFGVISAVIICSLMLTFINPILEFLGAKGETLHLASNYLRIILPTMPIMMIAMIANGLLRAHGDAKRAMYATLAGGIVNAILDPIFIFAFNLDLTGAAMASVCARIAMMMASLWPMIRIYNGFAKPSLRSMTGEIREINGIAAPAVLANIATPIGSSFVTRSMAEFGDNAVAGAAIIGRLVPVAFSVVFALSGAIGPIIGQNAGAGNPARVKEAYIDALKFTAIYVIAISLVLFILRQPIIALFNAGDEARSLILLFCGPISLTYFFVGIIFVSNASFNNLNHPFYSTWVNWGRNTVGTFLPIMLCTPIWGASGVLIGQALGSVVFAFVSLYLAKTVMNAPHTASHKEPFLANMRNHIVSGRRH